MIHQIDVERRDDQSPASETGVCVSRRVFMNSVVSLPIASAVPVEISVPASSSPATRDPIFAAIEAHKRSTERYTKCVYYKGDLENASLASGGGIEDDP